MMRLDLGGDNTTSFSGFNGAYRLSGINRL